MGGHLGVLVSNSSLVPNPLRRGGTADGSYLLVSQQP